MDWKATDNICANRTFRTFKVAGRGFAGLAIAYFLRKKFPQARIELFDPNPLGAGASGAASGLLEPIGGRLAIRSFRADEGLAATRQLLDIVSQHLGLAVYKEGGILHPPMSLNQKQLYQAQVEIFPEKYAFTATGDFWAKEGINVFSNLYLQGLFSLLLELGIVFIPEKISMEGDLFLAVGATIQEFFPDAFRMIHGQAMQVEKNHKTFLLPHVHKGYVALDVNPQIYHVGSTYERGDGPLWDAVPILIERNREIYPELASLKVLSVRHGTRVYLGDQNIPTILHQGKVRALTGLGSKGLLYHALYAKELVEYHTD